MTRLRLPLELRPRSIPVAMIAVLKVSPHKPLSVGLTRFLQSEFTKALTLQFQIQAMNRGMSRMRQVDFSGRLERELLSL